MIFMGGNYGMLNEILGKMPTEAILKQQHEIDCLWCRSCVKVGEIPDMFICAENDERIYYREGLPASIEPCEGCQGCK